MHTYKVTLWPPSSESLSSRHIECKIRVVDDQQHAKQSVSGSALAAQTPSWSAGMLGCYLYSVAISASSLVNLPFSGLWEWMKGKERRGKERRGKKKGRRNGRRGKGRKGTPKCFFHKLDTGLCLIIITLHYVMNEWMNEWKCGDLKCVQKPTRGRLSLTHLPVQPLSMVRESV